MTMAHPSPDCALYLWPRRTVYVGRLARPIEFNLAAASLTVALDGLLQYQTPDMPGPGSCTSLLLKPGERVRVDAGDRLIGTCYLDALGQDHALLAPRMLECDAGVCQRVPGEQEFQHLFRQMLDPGIAASDGFRTLETLINPGAMPYPVVDDRVARVVSLIHQSVAQNCPVTELAGAVNLSAPRLVQLFRQQVGVPIRRYRQWHRLFVTAIRVARGWSLTEAALDAGFTDSAHLSHTFRAITGLRPSDIFTTLARARLVVGEGIDKGLVASD